MVIVIINQIEDPMEPQQAREKPQHKLVRESTLVLSIAWY